MHSDRKKQLKRRAILSMIALCALLTVLFVYLSGFTNSRYRQSMTGYTDFNISSFHAVLLGNMTEEEVRNSWVDSSATIHLFGEDVKLDVIQPGRLNQTIPFSLANGTAQDNISSMDFDYTLRVRTTGNIPLEFILKEETSSAVVEDGVEITSAAYQEYRTSPDSCYLERDREIDAPRYIYPFFKVTGTAADGTPVLAGEETVFEMQGGEFQMKKFVLEMEWEIVPAEGNQVASNDQKYMKEVDVVDMLANVTTHNRSENYYADDPQKAAHENTGEGILTVYPGSETSGDGYVHQFEFRAFGPVTEEKEKTALALALHKQDVNLSSYFVYVTNGNNLYRGTALLAKHTHSFTDFQVAFGIPMTVDTMYENAAATAEREYYFFSEDPVSGEEVLLTTSSAFRSYDLYSGDYTDITEAEANRILLEQGENYSEDVTRVYKVYSVTGIAPQVAEEDIPSVPAPESDSPFTFRLANTRTEKINDEIRSVPNFDQQRFRVVIPGSMPNAGEKKLVSLESRLFMEVSAEYTDE